MKCEQKVLGFFTIKGQNIEKDLDAPLLVQNVLNLGSESLFDETPT